MGLGGLIKGGINLYKEFNDQASECGVVCQEFNEQAAPVPEVQPETPAPLPSGTFVI